MRALRGADAYDWDSPLLASGLLGGIAGGVGGGVGLNGGASLALGHHEDQVRRGAYNQG